MVIGGSLPSLRYDARMASLVAQSVYSSGRICLKSLSTKRGADDDRVVLVSEGGVERMPVAADPIQAWIDLMEVVEMLRPPGGPRPPTPTCGRFLL